MGPSERDPAIRRTRSGRLREQVFIGCFGKGAHGPASNSAERTLQKTALRKSASSPLLLNISSIRPFPTKARRAEGFASASGKVATMDHVRRARARMRCALAVALSAALTLTMLPCAAFAGTSGYEGGGSL